MVWGDRVGGRLGILGVSVDYLKCVDVGKGSMIVKSLAKFTGLLNAGAMP